MIRAVTPGDVAAITAIYAREVATGTASFEIDPPDEAEMRMRFERLELGGCPALVVEDGDGIAGYAYAGPFRDRAAFRFTAEDSVYLAERARGRGLGTRLLDALLTDSAARGFRRMVAVIGDSGNAASIALHARAGFAHAGTLEGIGWKFGRPLDVVMMQRAL